MSGEYKSQKQLAIEARRTEVSTLYQQRKSQDEIAEKLGVDQATISRDLSAITKEWQEKRIENLDGRKQEELARIDVLEAQYWRGWERSCTERRKTMAEQHSTVKGQERRDQIMEEGRDGNPAFLAGVQWCVEQRCKILGLYAPTKQEQTGANGGPLTWRLIVEQALYGKTGDDGSAESS